MRAGDDRIAVDEDVTRACGQVVFGNEGSLPFVVFQRSVFRLAPDDSRLAPVTQGVAVEEVAALTSGPSPIGTQWRTEHMSVKGLYGIGMRWLALTSYPSPARGRGEARTTRQGVPMRQKLGSLIYSVRP